MVAYFTVITSTTPGYVGKAYWLDARGRLKKSTVASIAAGKAKTIKATPENFVAALKRTTESTNQVILLDSFTDATPGSPAEIDIVTEGQLERLIGAWIPNDPGVGFYMVQDKAFTARLKRLMQNSSWILLDADSPEGMPAQWARLPLVERLKLLEAILPGISKCLRIEYRGSSARVVNGSGAEKPGPTHALIQISDPDMLDLLRAYVHVQSVLNDLAFPSPRRSRADPGKIVGHAHLTLIDWSVWILGRLIINAIPDLAKAPGYRVLGADPRIVNPSGGVLDISWITLPNADEVRAYRQKTGRALKVDMEGRNRGRGRFAFAVREDGQLRLDTEIEAGGTVRPLGEWLVEMMDGDIVKMRCEAPFRASVSEAAFVRITENGEIFVYDSGTAISSYLAPLPQTAEEARATPSMSLDVYEMVEAVIAARERRTQRQAEAAFPNSPQDPDDDENDNEPPVDLWKAIDTPKLPVGLLPPRVETFVLVNARALGADSAGLAGASIAALAAAIPDSVKLQVQAKGRKWLIAARIWAALVGDPSTKKTPIMDAALAALREKDMDRRQRYAALKAFWDALTKKEKAQELAAGRGPPGHNRLIINDTTAEAAGEILMTSPNGVVGVYDELSGWFGQMERYGQGGQGLSERGFWLQARNGGPHSIDRIIRGTNYIPNLSITLIGGIQPEPMRKVAGHSADDGLIQRLTPIMLRPAEMTDDSVDTEEADKDFADLIDTLLELTPTLRPLKFDQGAQAIRRELEIEHHDLMRVWEPINKKMSSAFGKQDGYFAELCVIWHAAENAGQNLLPELVTEDLARRAAAFMRDFLRPHMVAFYTGLLDLSDEHDRLKAIAGYILTHKPNTLNSREVQKAVRSMRKLGARDVTSIMEQLEAFGWLFRHPPPRHGALPVWKINPAVHVHFAEQAKEEAARRARDRATIAKAAAARRAARD